MTCDLSVILSRYNGSRGKAWHRFISLSTITSFFLLTTALLVIARAPAKGYEPSIYSATPRIFWIAIIFGLFNAFFLIASCLYIRSKMWMVGLFEIIFCNSLVLSLYALRGYVLCFGRGDASSYVGMASDVNIYGYIGNNLYPITSILISQISQMTNISVLNISKYIPSLYYAVYVLSVYCWSKSLIYDRKFILCSILASTPIFFAWVSTAIYHQLLSVLMLPFFFYLLQKNSDYRFRFLSIIIIIMYPFFHPITGIVFLLYMTVFFISEKLNLVEERKSISKSLLLLSFVALIIWFIQQYSLLRNIKTVLFQLMSLLKTQTSFDIALSLTRVGIFKSMRVLILMIADEIIFSLISLFVIYQVLLRKGVPILKKFYKISMCLIIGNLFLSLIFFFSSAHQPYRLINLNFNMILTPPLVGYLIYNFSINNKKDKTVLILGLIVFSSVIAIFSLYPSPITNLRNSQVTTMDIMGMNWLITQKNLEIKTADVLTPVFRFADLIYGCEFRRQRSDLYSDWDTPVHFGFNDDRIFPIDEYRYLAITEYDMKPYIMELWIVFEPPFYREDFIKINYCINVDKIYENGEFRTYFIHK